MKKKSELTYPALFSTLNEPEIPVHLKQTVISRIEHLEARHFRIRRFWHISVALCSFLFFVVSSILLYRAGVASDFWALLSLAVSDFSILGFYWQDFIFSLLETAPTSPLLLFVASSFLGGLSIAWLYEETRWSRTIYCLNKTSL